MPDARTTLPAGPWPFRIGVVVTRAPWLFLAVFWRIWPGATSGRASFHRTSTGSCVLDSSYPVHVLLHPLPAFASFSVLLLLCLVSTPCPVLFLLPASSACFVSFKVIDLDLVGFLNSFDVVLCRLNALRCSDIAAKVAICRNNVYG